MTKDLKIVVDYCNENIVDFEERVKMALDKIAFWKCSLQYADASLYEEIADAITECAEDYGVDSDNIIEEDVIWA